MSNNNLALEVREITKTFPGVRALDRVSFNLQKGEVHALVGENGAGKSTLMHILGGVYQPDSGSISLDGQSAIFSNTHEAANHGISVVFQELSLSENLSIAENVFANSQPTRAFNMIDWRELHRLSLEMLKLFDWDIDPATPVGELSSAKQQVVEILKAIARKPSVLILDEPTSSLTAVETEALFRNILSMKQQGLSVIYISHHLSEVFELADRVTVLRDGQIVDTCKTADVTEADLVKKMVGRELVDMYGSRDSDIGEKLFEVEKASRAGEFEGVSFDVRAGEIVGFSGLAGAGRTELARAIFGAERLDSGSINLDGEKLNIRSPEDAIGAGIAYLSEDRKGDGLFLDMSVQENCIAPSLKDFTSRFGMMNDNAAAARAENYRDRFDIATPTIAREVRFLSGGNQQKVLLAMWFGITPKLLIADEPTRGVDVGAKCEIYRLLRELAAHGVAIMLISSDLPEVLGLSDRVLVMRNGRLAGEFVREEATEEKVIACAAGVGDSAC